MGMYTLPLAWRYCNDDQDLGTLAWLFTHWGPDKMANIFRRSDIFKCILLNKIYELLLKLPWNLFLGVHLTIFQNWFRLSLSIYIYVKFPEHILRFHYGHRPKAGFVTAVIMNSTWFPLKLRTGCVAFCVWIHSTAKLLRWLGNPTWNENTFEGKDVFEIVHWVVRGECVTFNPLRPSDAYMRQ